jgi:hypothetical protein
MGLSRHTVASQHYLAVAALFTRGSTNMLSNAARMAQLGREKASGPPFLYACLRNHSWATLHL